MEWISVKKRLPPLSYYESDDPDSPFESYNVLLYCDPEICVGYLVKNQDEFDWNFGDMGWECYIPDDGGGTIRKIEFKSVTHWMELPEGPKI